MSRPAVLRGAVAVAAAALLAAGCGAPAAPDRGSVAAAPAAAPAVAAVPRAAFPDDRCQGEALTPLQSYAPDGSIAELRAAARAQLISAGKDRLVVGTSGDVPLWGARDPQAVVGTAGVSQLAGFDIEVAKAISQALFGDPNRITYKVISYAQRLPQLEAGAVDVVAHTMTINCDRWQRIEFSAEYYRAGQRVLVKKIEGGPRTLQQLQAAGQTVCVGAGSTNLELLKKDFPEVKSVVVDELGECLVKFQQGEADAITGDDTVLAGFASQDPYAEVVGEGRVLTQEPYGVGVKKGNTALVRFVNAVLQDFKDSGRWAETYAATMGTAVEGRAPAPPAAKYGR